MLALTLASPAYGHAALDSTNPDDGETLAVAPQVVELLFTGAVEPFGDGIVLFTADGAEVRAIVEQSEAGRVELIPAEPLPSGQYVVSWMVRSGDSHPISGSFMFIVDAPGEAAEPAPPSVEENPPVQLPRAEEAVPGDEAVEPAGASPTTKEAAPNGFVEESGEIATSSGVLADEPVETVAHIGLSESSAGEWFARFGRWTAMVGALLAIGAFAFGTTALGGTEREVGGVAKWIRAAGGMVIFGGVLEVLGMSMTLSQSVWGGLALDSITETVSGTFRFAVLLRLVGGAMLIWGTSSAALSTMAPADATPHPRSTPGDGTLTGTTQVREDSVFRLDARRSAIGLAGAGLVAVSYLFDGHTVTETPNAVVRLTDLIHVLGGGVWFGGIIMMAWLLNRRRRRGVRLDAAAVAVRFSRIAAVALVAVGVAGSVLAWVILDGPNNLTSSTWGRLLMAKVGLVAVVAALGAYNHYRVVPTLAAHPGDEQASGRLASMVTVEGAVLLAVVLVTAALVGAHT